MESAGAKRKLAVILAADFEGYSRLMHADEEATLETLRAHREIIDGLVARHFGHVFSTAGDSVMAEFGSAVEAVRCAISVQEELASHNANLPDERSMRLRIGVNLGDVMIEGDDLLGDGVNVAARLESIAEPGGICISGDVYHQVNHKLSVGFQAMGPQQVKNISEPVSAYRVVLSPASLSHTRGARRRVAWARWRLPVVLIVVIVAFSITATALWQMQWLPAFQGVPDRPSIAVLPFDNLTGNKAQDSLSNGLSEAIITELGDLQRVAVVARNSSFAYKGKPTKAQQVGRELEVDYVLEGSLQMSGERVRITAQLIEVATGTHLWAESYEEQSKDIFRIQDNVTPQVVAQILMILGESQDAVRVLRRAIRRNPDDHPPQLLWLMGVAYYYTQEYDEAITTSRQYLRSDGERKVPVRIILIASLVAAGLKQEAQAEAEQLLSQSPRYLTANAPVTRGPFAAFKSEKFKEQLYQRLREAGLPE